MPSGSRSRASSTRAGSTSAAATSASKPCASTQRRQGSVTRTWGRHSSMRRTTSAARSTGLSAPCGNEACDWRPRTVMPTTPMPLSLTDASTSRPPGVRRTAPPTSVRAKSVRTRSWSLAITSLAPWYPPFSSSGTAQNTRSPRGRNPSSARRRMVRAMAAVWFNMSTAPRPHTSPSTSSPPNGSRDQPSASSAGTTSVCPRRANDGASGSDPAMRATNEARPSIASCQSISTPGPSTTERSMEALTDSFPTDEMPSNRLTQPFRINAPNRSATSAPAVSSAILAPPPSPHTLGAGARQPRGAGPTARRSGAGTQPWSGGTRGCRVGRPARCRSGRARRGTGRSRPSTGWRRRRGGRRRCRRRTVR